MILANYLICSINYVHLCVSIVRMWTGAQVSLEGRRKLDFLELDVAGGNENWVQALKH